MTCLLGSLSAASPLSADADVTWGGGICMTQVGVDRPPVMVGCDDDDPPRTRLFFVTSPMGRPQKRVSCRAKASERLRISASVARIVAQYAVVFHVIFWFTTGVRADDDGVVDRSTPVPVVVVLVVVRLLDTVLTDLDRRRGEHVDGQHFAVLLLVVVVVILAIL